MPSLDMVKEWLRENVREYDLVDQITLDRFRWPQPEDYRGSFSAILDGAGGRETFHFYADAAGEIKLQWPMFVSPLGAPASYTAINLQPEMEAALLTGIQSVVPRLKPFGICPDTKQLLTTETPDALRTTIPVDSIRNRLLAPGFSVTVNTATRAVKTDGKGPRR